MSRIRHRAAARQAPRITSELIAELAARLTPRDRAILELVWEHRVLTTSQLTRIFFGSEVTARHRLLDLHRLGALLRARPWSPTGTTPWHFMLGPGGAYVLAAQRGITVKKLGYRADEAQAVCHSAKLAHLIGVNEFFTGLHAHARHSDDTTVLQWWSERRCAEHWGDIVRPDAYGQYRQGDAEIDFFLEHDTGSESLQRAAAKIGAYAELVEATEIITPVLFWLPSAAREENLRALFGQPEIPVATAVHHADGPAGPMWLPCGSTGPRRRLAELAGAWQQTFGQRQE